MSERTLLTISGADWAWLEEISKRGKFGEVLTEFWRKALGYTMSEWTSLPEGSFRVTDYEVVREDHDRLYGLMTGNTKPRSKANAAQFAMLWLNLGPACVEEE